MYWYSDRYRTGISFDSFHLPMFAFSRTLSLVSPKKKKKRMKHDRIHFKFKKVIENSNLPR